MMDIGHTHVQEMLLNTPCHMYSRTLTNLPSAIPTQYDFPLAKKQVLHYPYLL